MKFSLGIFSFFVAYKLVKCLDPYITGGSYVEYKRYPHSAYLMNYCLQKYTCGGSVLNQNIVLTAAHCLVECSGLKTYKLYVRYGHKKTNKMAMTRMKDLQIHQKYDEMTFSNDIGLIMTVDEIPLKIVKRVILMRYAPDKKQAYVAGWGIDENMKPQSSLKHTKAWIQSRQVCQRMGWLPRGVFCAGPILGLGAADRGDSGSALVIDNYIQIGIVSFKAADYSLVAYTNVSYFLSWIQETSEELFCLDAMSIEETQNFTRRKGRRCIDV